MAKGIRHKSQILMDVPPTDPSHITRKAELDAFKNGLNALSTIQDITAWIGISSVGSRAIVLVAGSTYNVTFKAGDIIEVTAFEQASVVGSVLQGVTGASIKPVTGNITNISQISGGAKIGDIIWVTITDRASMSPNVFPTVNIFGTQRRNGVLIRITSATAGTYVGSAMARPGQFECIVRDDTDKNNWGSGDYVNGSIALFMADGLQIWNAPSGTRNTSRIGDVVRLNSWDNVMEVIGNIAGTKTHSWSIAGNLTNISSLTYAKIGDLVLNASNAARTMLGATRQIGDVIKITGDTTADAAGNIRGASGSISFPNFSLPIMANWYGGGTNVQVGTIAFKTDGTYTITGQTQNIFSDFYYPAQWTPGAPGSQNQYIMRSDNLTVTMGTSQATIIDSFFQGRGTDASRIRFEVIVRLWGGYERPGYGYVGSVDFTFEVLIFKDATFRVTLTYVGAINGTQVTNRIEGQSSSGTYAILNI